LRPRRSRADDRRRRRYKTLLMVDFSCFDAYPERVS